MLAAILERQPGVAEFVNNAWVQVISVDPETGEMLLFVPAKGFVPWVPAGGEVPQADSVPDVYKRQSSSRTVPRR